MTQRCFPYGIFPVNLFLCVIKFHMIRGQCVIAKTNCRKTVSKNDKIAAKKSNYLKHPKSYKCEIHDQLLQKLVCLQFR